MHVCVIEMGGRGAASYIRDSYLGSKCRLILFNIVLSNHPHAHTHALQLDKVELGWVGVLWLNAFPVMLHRQASGLLSHYWPCLSLHLCLGTVFFTAHRTAARDTSANVVERDLNHILVMRYGPVWYC